MKLSYLFLAISLLTISSHSISAKDVLEYTNPTETGYDDSQDKPWQEDTLSQLTPSNDANLIEPKIDNPPLGFKIYIDLTSLVVSETDLIIRYWLVLRAGKSRNAQYEGIKCTSREFKTYAFEYKWDKTKIKFNPNAKWEPIVKTGHNQFREELRRYYFCNDVLPRKQDDILRRLKGYVQVNKHDDYLN